MKLKIQVLGRNRIGIDCKVSAIIFQYQSADISLMPDYERQIIQLYYSSLSPFYKTSRWGTHICNSLWSSNTTWQHIGYLRSMLWLPMNTKPLRKPYQIWCFWDHLKNVFLIPLAINTSSIIENASRESKSVYNCQWVNIDCCADYWCLWRCN